MAAVTFRRVGSELGVSHMTLYGYFASKHELLEALVARTLAESQTSGDAPFSWDEALLHRMCDIDAMVETRRGRGGSAASFEQGMRYLIAGLGRDLHRHPRER